MKITFLLPYAGLAGGVRVVAIYAALLKQRGHKVTVVSLPQTALSLKKKLLISMRDRRWPSHNKHAPSHFDGVEVDHIVLEKSRPIANEDVPDADVVIATWWETAEWVSTFSPAKGKKFYFIQHHEVHQGLPIERVKATYYMPLSKIVISRWLLDIMANEYGDSETALIPNSVDHNVFYAPERRKQFAPTVGFMYSPSTYKGCDIINESLVVAQKNIPDLRILSFGSCQPSSLRPLPQSAEFYYQPSQEKIREIYSSCDFWIFGSRTEGFGLPLLEAMACRTPVIGTPAGAAPELLADGCGFLIDDYSSKKMAEIIIKANCLMENEWQTMSNNAYAKAIRYSWLDAVEIFEKVILGSVRD